MMKLFVNLDKKQHQSFGYYRQFCDGSYCAELYFRETNPGDYCLIHGQVGICNKSFACRLPTVKSRVFPSFHVTLNNCSKSLFVPSTIYFLYNFLTVLFIILFD